MVRTVPDGWALTGLSPLQEQRSAVFVILFALITILILYSSNSANEVFHYGSLRGRTRRPVNLRKWSITEREGRPPDTVASLRLSLCGQRFIQVFSPVNDAG